MSDPEPVTLVLFDIDGTLVDVHGAGSEAFSLALKHAFGIEDNLHYTQFAGATDLNVLNEVLSNHGLKPTRKRIQTFFALLPGALRAALTRRIATPLPGARELLGALSRHPQAMLGLVTGNEKQCAGIKLLACGLDVGFAVGAYGVEHARREALAQLALNRARRAVKPGKHISRVVLLGDAPADISAARAIGAQCLAVATGLFNRRSLERLDPAHVLDDLRDTPAILRFLGLDHEA